MFERYPQNIVSDQKLNSQAPFFHQVLHVALFDNKPRAVKEH